MTKKFRHIITILLALQFLAYGTLFGGTISSECRSHKAAGNKTEKEYEENSCCAHMEKESAEKPPVNSGNDYGDKCGIECGCLDESYVEKEQAYIVRTSESSNTFETITIVPVSSLNPVFSQYSITSQEQHDSRPGTYILFSSLII